MVTIWQPVVNRGYSADRLKYIKFYLANGIPQKLASQDNWKSLRQRDTYQ